MTVCLINPIYNTASLCDLNSRCMPTVGSLEGGCIYTRGQPQAYRPLQLLLNFDMHNSIVYIGYIGYWFKAVAKAHMYTLLSV